MQKKIIQRRFLIPRFLSALRLPQVPENSPRCFYTELRLQLCRKEGRGDRDGPEPTDLCPQFPILRIFHNNILDRWTHICTVPCAIFDWQIQSVRLLFRSTLVWFNAVKIVKKPMIVMVMRSLLNRRLIPKICTTDARVTQVTTIVIRSSNPYDPGIV